MSEASKWLDGVQYVRQVLQEHHRDRHNEGRAATIERRAEMERLRSAGQEVRANLLEEREWKKGIQFMRAKRRAEQREAERELKKLGAAIRRETRKLFKRQPPDALFQQFEAGARLKSFGERDLYYDWIGRGLGSGKKRDYTREKKRSSARTTPWKSGEMGRKIRYIFREDALEEVEGNTLQNMGENIVEAVACSRLLQELEEIGREKNGGVYHHVIIALPHQLTGEERAQLLVELVQPLRDLKLPFCASLHKPDKRGDQRNFHAHVVMSLRPFERVGEYEWQFLPSKRTWIDTPAGLHLQRKFVARCFNRALARAGVQERWTHKSRSRRGEESPGNTKKGPERTRADRDEEQAAQRYTSARSLFAQTMRDERAAMMLDHASDIMTSSEPLLRACAEGTLSRLRDLSATSTDLLRGLDVIGGRLREIQDEQHSMERTRRAAPVEDEVQADISQAVERVGSSPEVPPVSNTDDEKRAKRRAKILRRIADADAKAIAEMAQAGGDAPPPEEFKRLREVIRAGGLRHAHLGGDAHRVFTRDRKLWADLSACLNSDKGRLYFRAIIDSLPEAPQKLEGWRTAKLNRAPDQTPKQQQATAPAQEEGLTVEELMKHMKGARQRS